MTTIATTATRSGFSNANVRGSEGTDKTERWLINEDIQPGMATPIDPELDTSDKYTTVVSPHIQPNRSERRKQERIARGEKRRHRRDMERLQKFLARRNIFVHDIRAVS